jgi:SAM-dependent methyltransferase
VGETGRVIGVDMTPEMIAKARENATRRGFRNVEFRLGDIESLPVEDASADVVVSNCVLNLVPDKSWPSPRSSGSSSRAAISSPTSSSRELPAKLRISPRLYVGCVAGALAYEDYMGIIRDTGFDAVAVKSSHKLDLPEEFLLENIGADSLTPTAPRALPS